jgi:hypothetical protein
MLRETMSKTIANDSETLRKFQRRAKRLLHRLATSGLGLRRNDFSIRVRDSTSGGSGLVSLQTDHWYIALSAPVSGRNAAVVTYAHCKGRNSNPTGPVRHARIDSVLDIHRLARQLRPQSDSSPGLSQRAAPLRSRMRR